MQTKHLRSLHLTIPVACAFLTGGDVVQDARAQEENPIQVNRNVSSFDQPVTRIYTGRSPFNTGAPRPAPAPAPEPVRVVTQPAPAPAPAPMIVQSAGPLVSIAKRAPAEASLGETFCSEIAVMAHQNAANVVVTDTLADGTTFVSADPPGSPSGKTLTWTFARMNAGETKSIKVCVKADKEGELADCATVTAVPLACASTFVGKPVLVIEKTGPEVANLGDEVVYNVRVTNKGTAPARGVRAIDTFPEGMTHWSGQRSLTVESFDLAAGASTTNIPVRLKATQRGKWCNVATAEASNAPKVTAEACTVVQQPGVKIVKSTKDTQLLINRTATYDIEVSNTGDTTLSGVTVSDAAAAGTQIVAAEGGNVSGNTATWNVGELKAGEKKNLTVKIMSKDPGKFCNTASVATAGGLKDSSEACTEWLGVTGVLVEVVDDPDPIQVGETTTFTIRVTNQGSTSDILDLNVKATFPAEMDPQSASGNATVAGKTVTFPVVPTLAAKGSVTYTIVGKGLKAGDSRLQVDVTTRFRQTPITELESTTIY